MASCHQVTSNYPSQCWSRAMSTYGITELTHWILLMLYDIIDLGQHWFRSWPNTSWHQQRSRLRRLISKIRTILLMDAKIWMTSLIIIFAVRPICNQDSIFIMSSESPDQAITRTSVDMWYAKFSWSYIQNLHYIKYIWKCNLQNVYHFVHTSLC